MPSRREAVEILIGAAATPSVVVAQTAKSAGLSKLSDPISIGGLIYGDTATGLTSTVDGQYFTVLEKRADYAAILFLNNKGIAEEKARYVSKAFIDSTMLQQPHTYLTRADLSTGIQNVSNGEALSLSADSHEGEFKFVNDGAGNAAYAALLDLFPTSVRDAQTIVIPMSSDPTGKSGVAVRRIYGDALSNWFGISAAPAISTDALNAALMTTSRLGIPIIHLTTDVDIDDQINAQDDSGIDLGGHRLKLETGSQIPNMIYAEGAGNFTIKNGVIDSNSNSQFSILASNCPSSWLLENLRIENWRFGFRCQSRAQIVCVPAIARNITFGPPAKDNVGFPFQYTGLPGQDGLPIEGIDIEGVFLEHLVPGAHSSSNASSADSVNFQYVRGGTVKNVRVVGSGEIGISAGWACSDLIFDNCHVFDCDKTGIVITGVRFHLTTSHRAGAFIEGETIDFSNGVKATANFPHDGGDRMWAVVPDQRSKPAPGDTLIGLTSGAKATLSKVSITENCVILPSCSAKNSGVDASSTQTLFAGVEIQHSENCMVGGIYRNPACQFEVKISSSSVGPSGSLIMTDAPEKIALFGGSKWMPTGGAGAGHQSPLTAAGNFGANRGFQISEDGAATAVENAKAAITVNRTGRPDTKIGTCIDVAVDGEVVGGFGNLGVKHPVRSGNIPYSVATLPDPAEHRWTEVLVSDGNRGAPCFAISDGSNWLITGTFGSPISGS